MSLGQLYQRLSPLLGAIIARGNGFCLGSATHGWITDLEPEHLRE